MARGRLLGGVFMVIIGALLLLNNLGYLDPLGLSAWQLIWPLALIGLGGWILLASITDQPKLETRTLTIPHEGETSAHIRLEFGVGTLNVAGGAEARALLTGTVEGEVEHTIHRDNQHAILKLKTPMDIVLPWEWAGSYQRMWELRLSEALPIELIIQVGACNTTLDLTHVHVTKLSLESGANATQVQLPAQAGYTEVRGSSGMASLKIHVPEGVAARIRTEGALSSVNVNTERFPRTDAGYESPDYTTAQNRVDIQLEAGISSVTIK